MHEVPAQRGSAGAASAADKPQDDEQVGDPGPEIPSDPIIAGEKALATKVIETSSPLGIGAMHRERAGLPPKKKQGRAASDPPAGGGLKSQRRIKEDAARSSDDPQLVQPLCRQFH